MSKKLKFPSLILLAGALASPIGVYADVLPDRQSVNISQQSGKVTGVVEDALGPVIGASVVIKGTTNGIMTDLDGKFTLDNVKKVKSYKSLLSDTKQKKSPTRDKRQ